MWSTHATAPRRAFSQARWAPYEVWQGTTSDVFGLLVFACFRRLFWSRLEGRRELDAYVAEPILAVNGYMPAAQPIPRPLREVLSDKHIDEWLNAVQVEIGAHP